MSDIKVVRLSTGEELLTTLETKEGYYELTDVAILIPTQQNSLGLAPFMAYCDTEKGLQLQPKDVMFILDPVKNLKAQYEEMFGKIVTPDSKIIV